MVHGTDIRALLAQRLEMPSTNHVQEPYVNPHLPALAHLHVEVHGTDIRALYPLKHVALDAVKDLRRHREPGDGNNQGEGGITESQVMGTIKGKQESVAEWSEEKGKEWLIHPQNTLPPQTCCT